MTDDPAFCRAYAAIRYLLGGEATLADAPALAAPLIARLESPARPERAAALAEALSEVARALEARRVRWRS